MKFVSNILFALLFSNIVFAQNSMQTNKKFKQAETNLLKNFPKQVLTELDYKLALNQIKLFEKRTSGEYSLSEQDSKRLIETTTKVVLWSEKNDKLIEQLSCKIFYLMLNTRVRNISKIIEISNELITYKEFLSDLQMNRTLVNLNFAYKSIEAYNEMIRIIPLRKKYCYLDPNGLSDLEYDLALAYFNTKNYRLAAKNFLIRKEYYIKIKDHLFTSSMSNNVGLCYFKLYDYKNAMTYFDKALKELSINKAKEHPTKRKGYNDFFKAVILSNIARIDTENGDFESAISANKYLLIKAKYLNESDNITVAYISLANIYLRKNDSNLAMTYLDSAKQSTNNFTLTPVAIEINTVNAKILALQGNIKQATYYFNKSKKITDSLDQVLISRENILAQAKYNSVEKDKELLQSKLLIEQKESAAMKQKLALFILLSLLIVIGLFYYKSNKDKNIIQRQAKKLHTSLIEKETLLKELHHRVKNNLQVIIGLLQLQSKKVNDVAMDMVLKDSQRHISSMALVHEMLYRQDEYSVVSMQNYITQLTQQILDSFHNQNIKISISVATISLSVNKVIPLGLIISELITNTYKYAFDSNQGTISITLDENASNQYVFIYRDSGKGLSKDFESNHHKTMGIKLLYMLAEEMNGTLEISSENGIKVALNFSSNEAI